MYTINKLINKGHKCIKQMNEHPFNNNSFVLLIVLIVKIELISYFFKYKFLLNFYLMAANIASLLIKILIDGIESRKRHLKCN